MVLELPGDYKALQIEFKGADWREWFRAAPTSGEFSRITDLRCKAPKRW